MVANGAPFRTKQRTPTPLKSRYNPSRCLASAQRKRQKNY
jgi:hypothetical protein